MTKDSNSMKLNYDVDSNDFTRAGEASSNIKKILKQLGVASKVIRKVSIATYEAEMNIAIHSYGGKINVEITPKEVQIVVKDNGPGIKDVNLAMKEGYSTATERIRELGFGAGMGLPNIKRCADVFELKSEEGKGTKVFIKIFLNKNT
ncbi:MAG: anti-sigma regulatory factor [Firmicutes bacterium]|nr:anti-sigma regulatory factor [Bacillota bacterium]